MLYYTLMTEKHTDNSSYNHSHKKSVKSFAAGWTNASRAAVWKIEGTSASLYKELSTVSVVVYALCAAGGNLYAAGSYQDTDYKEKPVWWHIAADGTVTEHKLGTEKGEARGICVTAQE